MKVYFELRGIHRTYHPVLGVLENKKIFDLDEKIAEKYIKSGLLKPVIEKQDELPKRTITTKHTNNKRR